MGPVYHCDLNLTYSTPEQADLLLNHAASLGYAAVALTYHASSEEFSQPKSKADRKSRPADKIPNPIQILQKSYDIRTVHGTPLHIFRRLSVAVQDSRIFHYFANHPLCKTFDILSVYPSDDKLLQQALDDPNVDIIELDLSQKRPLPVKRKHARQAEANLKAFEICYGNVTDTPEGRILFMANCQRLMNDLRPGDRGKIPEVLVLSSGIGEREGMRRPLEAGRARELLGVPEQYGGKMNLDVAWVALNNALARRRTAKGCLQIISI